MDVDLLREYLIEISKNRGLVKKPDMAKALKGRHERKGIFKYLVENGYLYLTMADTYQLTRKGENLTIMLNDKNAIDFGRLSEVTYSIKEFYDANKDQFDNEN